MNNKNLPADIDLGVKARGTDGKTPVRGVDYWTDADKDEIKRETKQWVEQEFLNAKF